MAKTKKTVDATDYKIPETVYEDELAEDVAQEEKEQAQRAAVEAALKADPNLLIQQQMLDVLGKLVGRQEAQGPQQVPLSKYKAKTPWHPTGERRRPKLSRATFLNNFRLQERLMSNEEIELCNQLRPGLYVGRKWRVVSADRDGEGSSIMIYLPNKTESDRLERKSIAPNLEACLRLIVQEQGAAA